MIAEKTKSYLIAFIVGLCLLIILPLFFAKLRSEQSSLKIKKTGSYVVDDINNDLGSDLLLFSQDSLSAKWRGYTLNGVDGPTTEVTNFPGEYATWELGDKDGLPVSGDYNGDGLLDFAVFARSKWEIYLSDAPSAFSTRFRAKEYEKVELSWGFHWAFPTPADYDGDGVTDIAVYHQRHRTWHIVFSSGDFNFAKASMKIKEHGVRVDWGDGLDVPVIGDYNGDGRADLALFQEGTEKTQAKWKVYYLSDSEGKKRKARVIEFGLEGDVPVPADYDCDGRTDIAVYRESRKRWYIRFGKKKIKEISWGIEGAEPIVGDYDRDGCADPAFYQDGKWKILASGFADSALWLMPNLYNVVTGFNFGSKRELPQQVWLRRYYEAS